METEISVMKSSMMLDEVSKGETAQIAKLFPMNVWNLDKGLKHLGFHINPNNYRCEDWMWLYNKIEARVSLWFKIWLPRGGKPALFKPSYLLDGHLPCP